MCSSAKQKVKETYTRLTNLNVTAMLGGLYSRDVITLKQKQQINSISIESDRMEFLLDEVIIPSLEAGRIEKFRLFLELMEGSDDQMVKSVGRRLGMLNLLFVLYLVIIFYYSGTSK